jgi:hypothetical protein
MDNSFEDATFREYFINDSSKSSIVKATDSKIIGKTKINVEEDGQHGVKIILKKDDKDAVKEIKFICSCGQTKSILLEYTEQ